MDYHNNLLYCKLMCEHQIHMKFFVVVQKTMKVFGLKSFMVYDILVVRIVIQFLP